MVILDLRIRLTALVMHGNGAAGALTHGGEALNRGRRGSPGPAHVKLAQRRQYI